MAIQTPLTSFREFFTRISPTWLQGDLGSKYVTGVIGLFGDAIQNLANMGVKAPWLKTQTSPDDALPLVGEGSNLPRYFTDTDTTYRARLNDRWNTWELAGTKAQLENQAVLMGFPNAQIFEPVDWPTRNPGYWSQFWLLIPSEDHSFTSGPTYGDGTLYGEPPIGSGSLYGIAGTNASEIIGSLKTAMCLFKPAHVILRDIIFEGDGPTYGDGSLYGDAGLVYGSTNNINISGTC